MDPAFDSTDEIRNIIDEESAMSESFEVQGVVRKIYRNERTFPDGNTGISTAFELVTSDGDKSTISGGFKKWTGISEGDEVFATYGMNGKYKNAKSITVVSKGNGAPSAAPQQGRAEQSRNGSGVGRFWSFQEFPVPPLAPERTINRQNAFASAVSCVQAYFVAAPQDPSRPYSMEEFFSETLNLARRIEEYTTGDGDLREAQRIANEESE